MRSSIGIWAFLAVIISAWSRAPHAGALNVFLFFTGTLLTYYIYSAELFHFFPISQFLNWTIIALASPLLAYIVWFSRGNGWTALLCASFPIGLLVANGSGFFGAPSIFSGADLMFAMILYIALPRKITQRLLLISFIIVIATLILKLNLISIIFGGL